MTPTARFKALNAASLWFALLVLAFLGLDRGLWTPDEPREAEISREMWLAPAVVPTLNGQAFVEKPPLYYWTVAAAFGLAGGPSPWVARLVSALAGMATLGVVFVWGRRAHSPRAGMLAAVMLATSEQFLVSAHWVLIDPLLMLATTVAAWTAWELLRGRDSPRLRVMLYAALVAALWIKGLVGPVLVGAGLLAYAVLERRAQWRALWPATGIAVLVGATGLLVLALWLQGGRAVVWEWAWVNHVQRLLHPAARTGHQQPFLYYGWTLPMAVLPWLPAVVDALRPSAWRQQLAAPASMHRYGLAMSAAMLAVLSLSATKREIYLLPLLPLLLLASAVPAVERLDAVQAGARAGALWWVQLALLLLWLPALPAAALVYLRRIDIVAAALLGVSVTVGACLLRAAVRKRAAAGPWAMAAALAASAWVLILAPRVLESSKNMAPFIGWVNAQLPAGQPVYATDVDETLQAIVPFETGRQLIALDGEEKPLPSQGLPEWILVQDNHHGRVAQLPGDYALLRSQSFGPGRSLALWHRTAATARSAGS